MKSPTYKLKIKLNSQEKIIETDNLKEAIMSVKPAFLKTKVVMSIEKDGKTCERQIFVKMAKQIFRSDIYLDMFIRKLIFK